MMRNNKGWLRLIELVLAAALVFAYFSILQHSSITEESRDSYFDTTLLKMHAQDALLTLNHKDSNGDGTADFRLYVILDTPENIPPDLQTVLPPNIGYNLYKRNASADWYCFVCNESIPPGRDTVAVDYIITEQDESDVDGLVAVKLLVWFK